MTVISGRHQNRTLGTYPPVYVEPGVTDAIEPRVEPLFGVVAGGPARKPSTMQWLG
jgi:hypothetical protein